MRDLANELDTRLSGRRVRSVAFLRDVRRVHFRFDEFTLAWDLDPGRGGLARGPASREPGNVPLARGTRIAAVTAPLDERIVEVALRTPHEDDAGARCVVIELVTNRWNAFALGADRRVLAILRSGAAAARSHAPGDAYQPPRLSLRLGARAPITLDEWLRLLLPSPPRERRRRIIESLAYTSPLNVGSILGPAAGTADGQALREAHARYVRTVSAGGRSPCLIDPDGAAQPYSLAVHDDVLPEAGLIEAFEDALLRTGRAPPPAAGAVAEEAADRLEARIQQLDRRIGRLRAELDGAPMEAESRRRMADLLMSQLHRLKRGDAHIDLEDFEGVRVRIELDPALGPAENAQRLYEHARKRDRASVALPRLIARASRERDGMSELLERIRSGDAGPGEIDAVLAAEEPRRKASRAGPSLPYRRYRTSGGLEVRVGRGSAANDALTFRHSSPNDIWLHARDVAGAHVVLRWTERDANPPARDIQQAAVLAALHSRARTSGTVPVDWTRRKYVRKPRKAPPGRVVIERAQTVFVEPSEDLAEKLRWDPLEDVVEG